MLHPILSLLTTLFLSFIWVPLQTGLPSEGKVNVLTVTSTDSLNKNIPFTYVYSMGNKKGVQSITTTEQVTPFRFDIADTFFTALIQDKSLAGRIEVKILTYRDGKNTSVTKCNFPLNVIQISAEEIKVSGN
ncbi:MAG: hypothetical protein L6Q77_00270 [Bacteroidetes bacterium]|nr:hypothetical protein [Bacteroidota bacterium]